jgi:hypothetical protein
MRRIFSLILVGILGLIVVFAFYRVINPSSESTDAPTSSLSPIPRSTASAVTLSPPSSDGGTQSPQRNPVPSQSTYSFKSFGILNLTTDFEVDGKGENVDSIAFWEAPEPADTLMFVTAKQNNLVEVWKYPFTQNEQPSITGIFAGGNVNGIVMDQTTDLLYVSQAQGASTITAFAVSDILPYWELQYSFSAPDLGSEPNQDILHRIDGGSRLYVTDSQKGVFIWNVDPLSRGAEPNLVGNFVASEVTSLETILSDDYYQVIYLPDENGSTGVYAYQPDGTKYERDNVNHFGSAEIFQSDEEGILLYTCLASDGTDTGYGLIVVADQRDDQTDFEFFNRRTWAYLGTLRIEGVSNTDGVASTQRALPGYPQGIFAAINDDKTIIGVGWEKIFSGARLQCTQP